MATGLLERAPEMAGLRAAARDAREGRGRIVLVHGEAGIGKSSLVEALRADPPAGSRVLVGACDAMSTPRTLGPLRDLAPDVGDALRTALRGGDREEVLGALQDELDAHPGTVVVLEDVHWADEATLDVIRFLGRRIDRVPAALVLTYRDELDRGHPLGTLLGDLGHGERVERLALERLSVGAVETLTDGRHIPVDRVFELTRGNPYFVSEIIASADAESVPPTVVDAVLGRLRRLDARVQDDLEQLAIVPSAVDGALLTALVPGGPGALRAAEEAGLLSVRPEGAQFRHELTRRAIVDGLPASRRIELEARALAALLDAGVDDAARIAHHAVEAGDVDAIVEWAPRAAAEAVASGAHRQAVAHLRSALEHADRFPPDRLVEIVERYAIESYTIGATTEASDRQVETIALRRRLGDPVALGASLRWQSRFDWLTGRRAGAEAAAAEASAVLAEAGDRTMLAFALSNEAQLALLVHDLDRARDLSAKAIAIARETGDAGVLSHALNNHGTAIAQLGDDAGLAELAEAAEIAMAVDDVENASRAYVNLIWVSLDEYRLDRAKELLPIALEAAERSEFIAIAAYHRVEQSRLELARAHWDAALATVDVSVDLPHARCAAMTVAGLVHLRRGDDGADEALAEAQAIADRIGEFQRRGPVGIARVEQALLRGDLDTAGSLASELYAEAIERRAHGLDMELAYLLGRAGRPVAVPAADRHPFALQARGDPRASAALWRELGCPYHEARALAESPDESDLLESLTILDRIGAEPLARQVRADLRARGVRSIPRGPSVGTRSNPEGLTDRQVDVLRLLVEGLTNAEIAGRLVVSVRTVDSHVAAVLGKLGVATRQEAARVAEERGILDVEAGDSAR
ncbi:ATP-binding protein [Agromyces bracchium]|uniref:AAA family ATPase n=1 Tax=Agromyces bracchium TaxID=88376 RepID=A0A6I3MAV0_9MICO|nr:LuxR family transcriptional regulator [Agromyces bracchium]MTH67623.1 AAA family ATPase [Agromyces bracchium]